MEIDLSLSSASANILERCKVWPERAAIAVPSAIQAEFQELWNIPKIPVKFYRLKALGQAKQVEVLQSLQHLPNRILIFTSLPPCQMRLPFSWSSARRTSLCLACEICTEAHVAEVVLKKRSIASETICSSMLRETKLSTGSRFCYLHNSCGSCLLSSKLLWPAFEI